MLVKGATGKNIFIQENALDINVCQYGRNFVRGDELKNVSWSYDAKRLYKLSRNVMHTTRTLLFLCYNGRESTQKNTGNQPHLLKPVSDFIDMVIL